jgi:hypothetical protein
MRAPNLHRLEPAREAGGRPDCNSQLHMPSRSRYTGMPVGTQNGSVGGLVIDRNKLIADLKNFLADKLSDATPEEREIISDYLEMAVLEAPQVGDASDLVAPKRDLSEGEVNDLKAYGASHRWEDRDPADKRSPIQWVADHYAPWMDGLLTSHIAQADDSIYASFMKALGRMKEARKNGERLELDIPTRDENQRRKEVHRGDGPIRPDEAIGRRWHARRMREHRARPTRAS